MVMSVHVFTSKVPRFLELVDVILRGFFRTPKVNFTVCTGAWIILRLFGIWLVIVFCI